MVLLSPSSSAKHMGACHYNTHILQNYGQLPTSLSTADLILPLTTLCKMIATLLRCLQHKLIKQPSVIFLGFSIQSSSPSRKYLYSFLGSFFVILSTGQLRMSRQDNPYAIFCPCSLWFHEPFVKGVTYSFLRLQIFPPIYRETHSAAFQLLDSMPEISLKKNK